MTDNGIQFAARAENEGDWLIPFDRMNRTTKEATTKRYHYGSHDALKQHL